MNEFTEVTAENLRFIRGAKGMNQDQVAELLGVPRNAISKIEGNARGLADSEKRLLDWYFFGTLPPKIVTSGVNLRGALEFDEAEWRMIAIMAARDGNRKPSEWIASRIRDYIAPAVAADEGNSATGTSGR